MSRGNAAGLEDYEDGPINDRREKYKRIPFWLRVGPICWNYSDEAGVVVRREAFEENEPLC